MVMKAMITKNVLTFEYLTPLAGTDCKTIAKVRMANYKNGRHLLLL